MKIKNLKLKILYPLTWFKKTNRKNRFIAAGAVIAVFAPIVANTFLNQPKEVDAWWSENWQYRKKFSITNSGSEQTDYQVRLTLDTASLISSGKMQDDCDDIRIADANATQLDYWLETGCNSSSTYIWTKVPTIPTTGITLYLYYGNSNASSSSNGENTFIFFDGFDGDSVNDTNWTNDFSPSNYSIGNSEITVWSTGSGWKSLTLNPSVYDSSPTDLDIVETKYKTAGTQLMHIMWNETNNRFAIHPFYTGLTGPRVQYKYTSSSYTTKAQYGTTSSGTYYIHQITREAAGTFRARTYTTSYSQIGTDTQTQSDWNSITFSFSLTEYNNVQSTIDWVRIRKYASTSPSIGSAGVEEKAPGRAIAYWNFDEGNNQPYSFPLLKNEQQINIVNYTYSVNSTTYSPSDNSLGIFRWNASKYTGATVYFEAILFNNGWSGTTKYTYASLYNTSTGTPVSSSEVSSPNSESYLGYHLVRSGAIPLTDLTDGQDYTVRIKMNITSDGYGTYYAYVRAARLIIVQSDSTKITNTQTSVDMGNMEKQSSNTATQLTHEKIYSYDSTQFNPPPNTHFEASLRSVKPKIEQQINIVDRQYSMTGTTYSPSDNSLGIFRWNASKYTGATVYFEAILFNNGWSGATKYTYASLYNVSTGNPVSGSEVSSPNSETYFGYHLVRSGAISLGNLTDGQDYTVRIKMNYDGFTAYIRAARLIIVQSDSVKITDTETQIDLGTYQTGFTNTTPEELANPKVYQYNADAFSPAVESSGDASFSATLKIDDATDTVYAELYNTSGNVVATASHTGDTNWTNVVVTNIDADSDWDTSNDDEYLVRVYCTDGDSDGCSGNIGNAQIILDQSDSNGISALETLQQQINFASSVTGTTVTDQSRFDRYSQNMGSANTFEGGTFTYYYEATLKTSTPTTTTGYSRLYNTTRSSTITTVGTTDSSYDRQRSGDITSSMPQYYQNTYNIMDTQIYDSTDGVTATVSNSWIIVQVSNLTNSQVTAYADLYNLTDNAQVTDSQISTTSYSWGLVRSGSITLDSGDEYVVRLRSSNNGVSIYLSNAKIILDQSDLGGIKAVETMQEYINTASARNGTYAGQSYFNTYNPSTAMTTLYIPNYNNAAAYFESTMKTSGGTGYARLYTTGAISGSQITTDYSDYHRTRTASSILPNMPTSSTNIDTQLQNTSAYVTVSNSWLVIDNNNTLPNAIHDASGNGDHGNNNGASWADSSSCISGNCLSFDGSNDFVVASDESSHFDFIATDPFTITTWFKHVPKTSGTDTILAKYNSSTGSDGGFKVLMESDGDITFAIDDDNSWTPDKSITTTAATYDDNVWHHLAVVKDGTSALRIYIDGILVAESGSVSSVGTLANTDPLYIGIDGDGSSNPYKGYLDEMKVYNYARSAADIKVDYAGGAAVLGTNTQYKLSDGLVGYWKMDEASGNASDSSGNGTNLTNNDSMVYSGGKFGNGVQCDGSADYLNTGTAISGVKTVSFWVYPASAANNYFINLINSSSYITINSSGVVSATGFTSPSIYVNGVLNGTVASATWSLITVTTSTSINANAFAVGLTNDGSNHFCTNTSKIDEVRLYNRLFSPSDVAQLYSYGPGPVGYWKMDEGSGSTSYDSSGNGNTSSNFVGSTSWIVGKFGSGLSFDGDGDYVPITESTTTDLGTTTDSYTVSAWVKTAYNSSGSQTLVAKNDGSGAYPYYLYLNSSEYACFAVSDGSNSPSACGTTSLADGKWHYLTGIRNVLSDKIYLYVDGVAITNTTDSTTATAANNDTITLGNSGSGYTENDLNGNLDDVKIYNYARTPAQIIEDMNGGHPAPGSPIGSALHEYQFEEGYGDTAHDTGTGSSDGNLAGSSANCPTGADDACPSWTNEGKFGKAISLRDSGVDDYIQVDNPTLPTTDFTYAGWVNINGSNETIIGVSDGSGGDELRIRRDSSATLEIKTNNSVLFNSSTTLSDNVWYHFVLTRSGNTIQVYINGKPDGSGTDGTEFDFSSCPLLIGVDNDTSGCTDSLVNGYNGYIDDLRVYNFALTPDQVKILYNDTSAASLGVLSTASSSATMTSAARSYCPPGDTGTCNPPIGEWKLDEGTGSAANDSSGNGAAGSFTGYPSWVTGKYGSGLEFDGSSQAVSATITNPGYYNTVEAWVYPTTSAVSKTIITASKLATDGSSQPTYGSCTGTALSLNQWTHITAVSTDSTHCVIYQNGILTSSSSTTGVSFGTGVSMSSTSNGFIGILDNVRIYNYARTPAQVAWDYNHGAPVAQYDFDECTDETLHDTATKADKNTTGINATITANSSRSTGSCNSGVSTEMWNGGTNGKYSASLDFDGAGDYATTSNVALISTNSQTYNNLAWGEWIKPGTDTDGDTLIHKGNEFRLTTASSTGLPQCEVYYSSAWHVIATAKSRPTTGAWTQILCTYDGVNGKLYVNGKLDDYKGETNSITSSSSTALSIARDPGDSGYFDGQIDNVKIFNYALTPQQVLTEYNEGGTVRYGPN